jgi:CRISPR-associated endonuclease/helicase Cas3
MLALPTFDQLLAELPPLATTLTDAYAYHGHSAYNDTVTPETLAEHMRRVMLYFGQLVRAHGLDAVADTLITEMVAGAVPLASQVQVAQQIKHLVVQAVWHHDFGKVNAQYQAHIQNARRPEFLVVAHDEGSHHAIISAYLFVVRELAASLDIEHGDSGEWEVFASALLALAYPVERHHSSRLSDALATGHSPLQGDRQKLQAYLPLFKNELPPDDLTYIHKLIGSNRNEDGYAQSLRELTGPSSPAFPLYALVRLTFSLLTASDFYGTAHYYHGWDDAQPYDDFGLITGELRKKIIHNARALQPYNRAVTEHLAERLADDPMQPAWQVPSANNLNHLRSHMAAEVIATVQAHAHERLFYLHAPTGGGKTNLSMLAAAELLDANPELTKIYYVFPFTTLITQTAQALRDTLGLSGDEVTELHGRAAYKTNEADPELDARYGRDHRTELDNLFVNFPVCLLTHVRFVDILKTSRKEPNYLLHRLANSVVILDELQSYDPRHWDKLAWLMKEYAHAFNIRFVLMSATLPRLGALKTGTGKEYVSTKFQELLPDAGRFIRNPNFAQRVRFDFSLETSLPTPEKGDTDGRTEFLEQLAGAVLARSEEWATAHSGQVRTVIEFIFKKTATDFHALAKQLLPDYTLLVLSGTILEHRRRTIIHFLKNQPAGCPKVLLITTQVVEAGVDIDMDLGFKDRSLLDSEEQLAGRVNRNATKAGSMLYLFRLDSAKLLYGKDRRYGVQESRAFRDEAADILTRKDFDKLYGEVMSDIDSWNAKVGGVNIWTYQDYYRRLNFPTADQELQMIEQETGTLFIPCEMGLYPEVWADGEFRPAAREHFANDGEWAAFQQRHRLLTKGQLDFLAGQQVGLKNGRLAGQDVLALRKQLIEKPGKSRDEKQDNRKNKKQLQGILALFTCSLFAQSKDMQRIETSGYALECYGIWALRPQSWREIYSVESGLDGEKLALEESTVFL